MIVVDSNIVVPVFVRHDESERCRALFALDPDWHLADWWQVECANVLRNYHRAGLLDATQLHAAMESTLGFLPPTATHPVDVVLSLRLACDLGISAYDARFIALARHYRTQLVTEDKRLRIACPDDTRSLEQALTVPS
jgi:predicted nucleic acid-binding protein